ncbi:alpha/beta hydrolase [Mycobacterium asiaticum]|uniref:Alpha/beta hydrolase n=1 Tax=Mycobacterium asiaticum TaxID=1790 RepID=A0A1A3NIG0_MYCAS|nr:alpha/beta fold hydrolase [Mycobacterium asiaticum]OBK21110.1 alpha/beta hydrolase [Mycobacterium asiaticum]
MTIVTATDGVELAVHRYNEIDPARPTILAVHGYPDNHRVWDGVAEVLAQRYNVVAYDVRGAGESACPPSRSGYRLSQLVADVGAVIDSLDVGRVHLLAHDWGSVQGWAAVTDDAVASKVASFTSISGPHLTQTARFLRSARTPRAAAQVLRQVLSSGYIWLFLCPAVPELAFRSGLGVKVVEALERIGRPRAASRSESAPRSVGDYVNGLNLYRENLPAPLMSPGRQLPQTGVAVQILVPTKDIFITPALQRFMSSISQRGRVFPVDGGHWVVTSRPDAVARLTGEWVDSISTRHAIAGPVGNRAELGM